MKKRYNPNDEIATNYPEKDIHSPKIGSYYETENTTLQNEYPINEPNNKTKNVSHEIETPDMYAVVYKVDQQTEEKPIEDPISLTRDSFEDSLYANPYELCRDSAQELQYTNG